MDNLFAYSPEQLAGLPKGAIDLSLGCANPVLVARLRPGEIVVDLGCGGGIDTLLAARNVGEGGLVVGVDRLPPMLQRAQSYAQQAGLASALFVCADLTALPFPHDTLDVAISNNALNLLANRRHALAEAFRVLKAGGRFILADSVETGVPTSDQRADLDAWANLPTLKEYEETLPAVGFVGLDFSLGPVLRHSGPVLARPMLVVGAKP